jgi:hypothetical protein
MQVGDDRHPGTKHFERLFSYSHLPEGPLRQVSSEFSAMADSMVFQLHDGPELTSGLRKLLEAKDCMVRAALLQATL